MKIGLIAEKELKSKFMEENQNKVLRYCTVCLMFSTVPEFLTSSSTVHLVTLLTALNLK